jgi:hypothetical protein
MNERIRELLKQSTNPPWDGEQGPMNEFNLERFAELIVQECADIALKKGMASPDTDFRTGSILLSEYLLVRFGVEE